jgi:hypothetical protein
LAENSDVRVKAGDMTGANPKVAIPELKKNQAQQIALYHFSEKYIL